MTEQGLSLLREFVRRALPQLNGNADDVMEALRRQSRLDPALLADAWEELIELSARHARRRRAVQERPTGD